MIYYQDENILIRDLEERDAEPFLQGVLDMPIYFWLMDLLVLPVVAVLAIRQLVLTGRLRRQIAAGVKPVSDSNWRKRRRFRHRPDWQELWSGQKLMAYRNCRLEHGCNQPVHLGYSA